MLTLPSFINPGATVTMNGSICPAGIRICRLREASSICFSSASRLHWSAGSLISFPSERTTPYDSITVIKSKPWTSS